MGGVSQAHDGNGNLKDDGTYLYEYNYRSLLSRVKLKSDNSTVATYKHDALGRRVEKDLGDQQALISRKDRRQSRSHASTRDYLESIVQDEAEDVAWTAAGDRLSGNEPRVR